MDYSVVKRIGTNITDKGPRLLVVAYDRIDALANVIGPYEEIAIVRGTISVQLYVVRQPNDFISIKGEDLVGTPYIPLFASLDPSKQVENADSEANNYLGNPLRIIPASYVTADSGTGLVHCAPAHGADDYSAFRALEAVLSSSFSKQNVICHIDGEGKFTADIVDVVGEEAGKAFIGKEVLKGGGKAVVDLLRSMGEDVMLGVEKIKHRYPYDWKTGEPVIVT
jgi:isoleucyl-tRNA synthetase